MKIVGYIACALLFLMLLIPAVFISGFAVEHWRSAESIYGNDLTLVEEQQGHAVLAGLMALPFWIGAILAVVLPLRARRLEKKRLKS